MDNKEFKISLEDMNNEIDAAASIPAFSERDFEKQRRTSAESDMDELYDDGTAVFLSQDEFIAQFIDWLSEMYALDLISTKNIDVLVYNSEMKYDVIESNIFDKFVKKNKLEIKLHDLCKKIARNGIGALWLEPDFFEKGKYVLSSRIDLIQMRIINNEVQAASFLVNLSSGVAVGGIYAMVYADKTGFQSRFYNIKSSDIKVDHLSSENAFKDAHNKQEITKQRVIELLNNSTAEQMINYLTQDHNFGFVPVIPLYFNENYAPVIKLIKNDVMELYAICQKRYDEAHFMGTKVLDTNTSTGESLANNEQVRNNRRVMAANSVLVAINSMDSDNARANIALDVKTPIWSGLNDAYKGKLNDIFKKLGLSTDTDSKGTVQQTSAEILMQNQFSYNFQNYRNTILQSYIQELCEKLFIANNPNKVEKYNIFASVSQSLGMSEMEKLQYVVLGLQNGIFDNARAISIISGKNYVDSKNLVQILDLENKPEINAQVETPERKEE